MIGAERDFASPGELAAALASDVADCLRRVIEEKGSATLAVSGGTTPRLFLETFSRQDIPWADVIVTLVDERQVPDTSERSNAGLVRRHLLKGAAAAASFVPLHENPEAAKLKLDAVVLGMGSDGHTASFFPGGDRLAEALDPATPARIIAMRAPGASEPRLTFSLAALLEARFIALHIEGDEKRSRLASAMAAGPVSEMPVRAVLRGEKSITIYWCP